MICRYSSATGFATHFIVASRAVSSFSQAITSPYPVCRRLNTSKNAEYPVLEAVSHVSSTVELSNLRYNLSFANLTGIFFEPLLSPFARQD